MYSHFLIANFLILGSVLSVTAIADGQQLKELDACRENLAPPAGLECSRQNCRQGFEYLGSDCTCHRCPLPDERPRHPARRWRQRCVQLLNLCEPPHEVTTADPITASACRSAYTGHNSDCRGAAGQSCPAKSHYLSRDCTCELCPSLTTFPQLKLKCLQLLGLCHVAGTTSTAPGPDAPTSTTIVHFGKGKQGNRSGGSWSPLLIIIVSVILVACPIVAFFVVQRVMQRRPPARENVELSDVAVIEPLQA